MDIMAKTTKRLFRSDTHHWWQMARRKLPVRDSEGLRPTTDRIKETLFNWLMPIVREARCLDCFAGSGALGFEALSRFADSVTFIELDKKTYNYCLKIKFVYKPITQTLSMVIALKYSMN